MHNLSRKNEKQEKKGKKRKMVEIWLIVQEASSLYPSWECFHQKCWKVA